MTESCNVIWVGPTGVGKTGLATGFLIQAIRRGYTGRHVLFRDLVDELFASAADHSEQKVLKRNILPVTAIFFSYVAGAGFLKQRRRWAFWARRYFAMASSTLHPAKAVAVPITSRSLKTVMDRSP